MLHKILLILILISVGTNLPAQPIQLNLDHPEDYIVQKGDTLWEISGRFLEQPWRWPEIWEVNAQIENPHLIYPGDIIRLSYQEGSPI